MSKLFATAYVFGVVWLGGWELAALIIGKRTGNESYTLSDMTWAWEGIGWTFARYLTLCFLTWLTLHLSFKWLR